MEHVDKLTGFFSYRSFIEIIGQLNKKEQSAQISLIFIDVLGLNKINKLYGPNKVEKMLSLTADIIKNVCPDNAIVTRLNVNKFAVVLINKKRETTDLLCNNLKRIINTLNVGDINLDISLTNSTNEDINENIYSLVTNAALNVNRNNTSQDDITNHKFLSSLQSYLWNIDPENERHTLSVRSITNKFAKELSLDKKELANISTASLLHDIGKCGIPKKILYKKDKLKDEEWLVLKQHVKIGYNIVKSVKQFESIAKTILFHHERWDGQGYLEGLSGKEIPLHSRILTICDSYDVMVHGRFYKPRISKNTALRIIKENAGTQFDPELADYFVNYSNKVLS